MNANSNSNSNSNANPIKSYLQWLPIALMAVSVIAGWVTIKNDLINLANADVRIVRQQQDHAAKVQSLVRDNNNRIDKRYDGMTIEVKSLQQDQIRQAEIAVRQQNLQKASDRQEKKIDKILDILTSGGR